MISKKDLDFFSSQLEGRVRQQGTQGNARVQPRCKDFASIQSKLANPGSPQMGLAKKLLSYVVYEISHLLNGLYYSNCLPSPRWAKHQVRNWS